MPYAFAPSPRRAPKREMPERGRVAPPAREDREDFGDHGGAQAATLSAQVLSYRKREVPAAPPLEAVPAATLPHAEAEGLNVLKGILLKTASALLFSVMSGLVRWTSDIVPTGEAVFFRSTFAILPVVLIYAWRRELGLAVRIQRPWGHLGRGLIGVGSMFFSFAALGRLSLTEVTAIGYAAPLMTVALAALILKERVRLYRWSAVGVGLLGVLLMLSPHLTASAGASPTSGLGAALSLAAALCSAVAVIQTRRLMGSETTPAIVFYFSVIASLAGLLSAPFGWVAPSGPVLLALVAAGLIAGLAQLLMTESFRLAPASVVAPFDYTTMLWAFALGYAMFGEVPSAVVLAGAAVVMLAGLFVIWRERQLGLERARRGPAAIAIRP